MCVVKCYYPSLNDSLSQKKGQIVSEEAYTLLNFEFSWKQNELSYTHNGVD